MKEAAAEFMTSWLTSAGFLWGWRWEGVHLQGAQVHSAVWDLPEAPQTLFWQIWAGECQDHPGLWEGEIIFFFFLMVNGVTWQLWNDVISPFSTRGTFDSPIKKGSFFYIETGCIFLVPMTVVPITLLASILEKKLLPSPPLTVK